MDYTYRIYYKKKKSGKLRKICVPNDELKSRQRELLTLLTETIPMHRTAYAFIKNRNIVDNAKVHLKSRSILNIDLSDFFDTINAKMVYKSLIDNHIDVPLATEITRDAIIERFDHLPQGSPLSPFLANLYCKPMDKKFFTLCKNNGLKYTRYADDISISGNVEVIKALHQIFHEIIISYGLKINYKKEELCSGYRKKVTGLNVFNKISSGRKNYQNCRTAIHRLNKELNTGSITNDYKQILGSSINSLEGRTSFISYVNPSLSKLRENAINIHRKIKEVF